MSKPLPFFLPAGLSEGHLDGPSLIDSLCYGASCQSHEDSPLSEGFCLSVMSNKAGITFGSAIVRLLARCRPSDVAGFVIAIVINAVKCVTFFAIVRELRNVLLECFKRVAPIIADGNTATAVAGIHLSVGIGAACQDVGPSAVGELRFASWHKAMRSLGANCRLLLQTAARQCFAACEAIKKDTLGLSAITLTMPFNTVLVSESNGAKRDQTTKSLIGNISRLFGKGDILRLHKNLHFLCQAWDARNVAGHFLLVCYCSILPHLLEWNNVLLGVING